MENETYSNTCTCVVYYERLSAEKPSMVEDKEKSVWRNKRKMSVAERESRETNRTDC